MLSVSQSLTDLDLSVSLRVKWKTIIFNNINIIFINFKINVYYDTHYEYDTHTDYDYHNNNHYNL